MEQHTISLADSMGNVLELATINDGVVRVSNTYESPLAVTLSSFLFGSDLKSIKVLVDGKSEWVPRRHLDVFLEAAKHVEEQLHG